MNQRRTHAQGAQHAENQPVDVEEGQSVDECVLWRPIPHMSERVEIRSDRCSREDNAFRSSGGS